MGPTESEIEMSNQTVQASSQPRRIEPIFDASGALRRVPAAHPASAEKAGRSGASERD